LGQLRFEEFDVIDIMAIIVQTLQIKVNDCPAGLPGVLDVGFLTLEAIRFSLVS
jgi:hypothetical protein